MVSPPDAISPDGPALAAPGEADDRLGAKIRAEQTRLLMQGMRASVPASIAIAAVMSYVLRPLVDHTLVAAWLGAVVLVSLARGALAFAYLRSGGKRQADERWLPAFIAGTALAGALWGLGAWMLFPADSVAHQAFLGVLVAGLSAGAVTTLAASMAATLTFLVLSLYPLTLRFLLSDQEVIFALGLLTILFLGITTLGARRMNASITQNIHLRLQSAEQMEALRQSDEQGGKLSMVAARTDNAVIITDRLGRIEWVNDGFTRITGYTLAEVAGRTPGSVLQGPDIDGEAVERMRRRLRAGQGFEEEVLNHTKDGRPYWVSLEVQPIANEAGETVQFMAIERDVTKARAQQQQLEQARREAERASQAKSDFLAMMSHEVRTPLNGVLGALGLLLDTDLDASQRKYAQTGRRSAEWLLSIINNILDFSKMEAGKFELEPAVFDVHRLVGSVVEILEPRASEKAISIVAEIDRAVPPHAVGDSTKIRQILLNLASNGVKFTARGEVRIGVAVLERHEGEMRLRFSVTDTGAGIELEQQKRVFEEFWTRSGSRVAGHEGTGLGLSISRRLVQILGGEIGFESQPGRGSRFWFDIPLSTADAESVPREAVEQVHDWTGPAEAQRIELRGRVLVAEDNPANQLIVQSLLTRLGLQVDVVANGLEAVDAVRTRPYDLVLMDIGMPEMDGISATRAIRAMDEAMARVPIVAVTAHVMRGERESLLAQGLDDYLSKPIDRQALMTCLRRWLTGGEGEPRAAPPPEAPERVRAGDALVDRDTLDRLLEDVGPESAQAVMDAFIDELTKQTAVLEGAADRTDLALMAQAAHRLKSSAASLGALQLSQLAASIEQAARSGQAEAAVAAVGEFRGLSRATRETTAALRRTLFAAED